MTKAIFKTTSNTLIINKPNGEVITKAFRNKSLFSAKKTEKIQMLKHYITGYLNISGVSLAIQ